MNLTPLEKKIKYSFKSKDFLKEALTHRSYLNENPKWGLPHNERLEFLGDAVLELVITEELFNRYPDYPEGQLTSLRAALVNYQMLSEIAKEIGLEDFLLLSRGEAKDTGKARQVILANAMEALIGAVYLDGKYAGAEPDPAGAESNSAGAKKFVNDFVLERLESVIEKGLFRDPKSTLQEKTQAVMKVTPVYKIISETGPDHAKEFIVGVYVGEKLLGEGKGASKQEAEVEAAKAALSQLDF